VGWGCYTCVSHVHCQSLKAFCLSVLKPAWAKTLLQFPTIRLPVADPGFDIGGGGHGLCHRGWGWGVENH